MRTHTPQPGTQPVAARWSRRAWGALLGDQALSGLSNALAVVLVARVLDPDDFGRFALSYACLTFLLGLSRSYFGNRLVLADADADLEALTGALLGAVVLLAPLLVLLVVAGSVLASGTEDLGLCLVVGVATPVVCAQDLVRAASASRGRVLPALVSDAVWVLTMGVAIVVPVPGGADGVVEVWLGAAVLAAVLALALAGVRPRLRPGLAELRRRDPEGNAFAVGGTALTAASLLLLWCVARLLDEAAAGSLRGAATTMGPVNVLLAFSAVGVTAAVARGRRGQEVRTSALVAAGLCGCVLLWGAVLLLLPEGAGHAAFGDSWRGVRRVLPYTVTEYVLLACLAAAVVGLKARRRADAVLRTRLVQAVVTLAGGGTVALVAGRTTGVAGALAASAGVGAALAWGSLLRDGATADVRGPASAVPAPFTPPLNGLSAPSAGDPGRRAPEPGWTGP